MANELRVRQNFLGGLVEDNPLTNSATTLTSAGLAAMVAIGSTQYMPITLDPDGLYGEPEVVYITAHTAAATTATILRAQEGTTARQHKQDMNWSHGPTIYDIQPYPEQTNVVAASGAAVTIPEPTDQSLSVITLTANCTFTFPALFVGKSFTLVLVQDATGSRTVTWPATVRWPGGVAPTLTTTAARGDVITFFCPNGTVWLGSPGNQNYVMT